MQILPLIKKHRVLHFNKTDTRLANNGIPVYLQKLRCRVNFQALKFSPQIETLGYKLIRLLLASEIRDGYAGLFRLYTWLYKGRSWWAQTDEVLKLDPITEFFSLLLFILCLIIHYPFLVKKKEYKILYSWFATARAIFRCLYLISLSKYSGLYLVFNFLCNNYGLY